MSAVSDADLEPSDSSGDSPPAPPPRRRRTALFVAAAVAIVLGLLIVTLATRSPATDRRAFSPLVGKPAPGIVGETLDGGRFDGGERQGRWLVVNFFASWCVPCRVEHPELRAFAEEHAADGDAEVVSVVFGDEPSDARRFFADNGGEWPVVLDDGGRIALDYGVAGVPESYLVDPGGIVRLKITGGVTGAGLNDLLAEGQGRGS